MINLKWEYKRVQIKYETKSELELKLNFYGDLGWEVLVFNENVPEKFGGIFETYVLLKRKKISNEDTILLD